MSELARIWRKSSPNGVQLQRAFIRGPREATEARLLTPPVQLPFVGVMNDGSQCFELPLALLESEDRQAACRTSVQFMVSGRLSGEYAITLESAPPLPKIRIDEQEEPGTKFSATIIAEAMIDAHLEAVNEAHFPEQTNRTSAGRPPRAEGMSVLPWIDFLSAFQPPVDDDEARMRLIVRIATECYELITDIADRPRRILRRERRLTPINRAQQLDSSCIRWLIRQPGRRIAEKAGPKRQVMSVVRSESADTLENRVAREFLDRSRAAVAQYDSEHPGPKSYSNSRRLPLVRRFGRQSTQLIRRSPIGSLPWPSGIVQPNYVLQFDDRYSRLWQWYERLRHQQTERDNAWRWQHRVWAERCVIVFYAALDQIFGEAAALRTPAYIRLEQERGTFVDARSLPRMWLHRGQSDPRGVIAIPGSCANQDVARTWCGSADKCECADAIVSEVDRFECAAPHRSLVIWSSFEAPSGGTTDSHAYSRALHDSVRGELFNGARVVHCYLFPTIDEVGGMIVTRENSASVTIHLPLEFRSAVTIVRKFLEAWL